ncbi:DUF192 domain-containing protein [Paracoccus solventivorans]|uniref:DUF192 domain-containing protein n=1 Tax=Paracoccus solventivorans TaxID=53463 RepID=UPI0026F01AA4|nr:DUF192 domain-containing protein [Paracoccus solventivorans]
MRGARRIVAGALLPLALSAGAAAAQGSCDPGQVVLTTPSGSHAVFSVEIAADPAARARGLMGRRQLLRSHGMLFVYEAPQPAGFWMKDTLIPLDMLFFDEKGVLRHVHPQAQPHDLTIIPGAAPGDPDPDRLLVLELAGGEAARRGLVPGTTLRHPAVPQATAAAPCD